MDFAMELDGSDVYGRLIEVTDMDDFYHMRQNNVWKYLMDNSIEKVLDREDEQFSKINIRTFYQNNREW